MTRSLPHRRTWLSCLAVLLALAAITTTRPEAQESTGNRGHVGLALVLRQLATTGTVMHVTAHPDDENNALMAMQRFGQGLRVVLATATRGTGGQNEIGPELFDALGVLRTEELLAAHEHDGAEQYFARAVDFGYTFSIEETFEKWGREEILGDYVRLIRMTRPDVMVTMRPDLPGGGKHHQASALIGLDAFRAAADPKRYPEQLAEGLRPWQPRKIYKAAYYGFFRGEPKPPADARLLPVDAEVYDPLLGRTYVEIGSRARAMHKCQGFGQLLALPGSWTVQYQLADSVIPGQMEKDESGMLDGLDLGLPALARFTGDDPPASLVDGLDRLAALVGEADAALRRDGPIAAVAPLARGLALTRDLRAGLEDAGVEAAAAYEIDFRLARAERLLVDGLVLAQGLRIEALADDGVVTPGQTVNVQLIVANRGSRPVAIDDVALAGFDREATACRAGELAPAGVLSCEEAVGVPASAPVTEPYWTRLADRARYVFAPDAPFGLPFRPSPFQARVRLSFAGVPASVVLPVRRRYEGTIFSGEKRMDLLVVPALTARVTPEIAILPVGDPPAGTNGDEPSERTRTVGVTVTRNAPGGVEAEVLLSLPEGWTAEPARARVRFDRPDQADAVTFTVRAPRSLPPGTYRVKAAVETAEGRFVSGYQVIEYPHIERRHLFMDAEIPVKAIDVAVAPGLRVGYVMGVGDQVPQAIEQLGATVRLLSAQDLAAGDLGGYSAIVTGVRAYERRADLRAYNQRLIEYARRGGTVIVQYNKFEFNQAQYGPYPAKVSANRVTDEDSPVTLLAPDHPVFRTPNPIDESSWRGWVQERGLYFLGERDPQYVDLIELSDPFPENSGPKRGALVEARVGEGRWVYVGLGLFRQLPAGTVGAYELLANLLSLGAPNP